MFQRVDHIVVICVFFLTLLGGINTDAVSADIIVGTPPFNPDPGQEFDIDISVDVGTEILGSYVFGFQYDPTVVNIASISGGSTLEFSVPPFTNFTSFASGQTLFAASQANLGSPSGLVSIATIRLVAVGQPTEFSNLDIVVTSLNNANAQPLFTNVIASSVIIGFDSNADPDNDNLRNQDELASNTDPNNPDTDGDGLLDGFEVQGGLDPLDDGTNDSSQGANGDPDSDNLTNTQEQTAGTNPNNPDTDSDGLADDVELGLELNATNPDTDGDGLQDGFEQNGGLDPQDDGSIDPNNGATGDPDNDGLTNNQEQNVNTNPTNNDTDGDTLLDGYEVTNGLDPFDDGTVDINQGANGDPDFDNLTNAQEQTVGTNPNNPDTDGDTLSDSYELANALNPLDDGSVDPDQGATGDPDNDGHTNFSEFDIGSDPQDDHSQPLSFQLSLTEGTQAVYYPLNDIDGFSSFDMLSSLNSGEAIVSEVRGITNGADGARAFIAFGFEGDDFDITQAQGVMARVQFSGNLIIRQAVNCPVTNLNAGINIIGIRCIPPGYTSFQMLSQIGNDTVVSSIQKYNIQTGRYETAIYVNDVPSGDAFLIQHGEAYIVHMLTSRGGFDPLL